MSHAAPAPSVRHCDVCVVSQTAAALAVALELVRAHRSVIVVGDVGGPASADSATSEPRLEAIRGHGGEVLDIPATAVAADGDGGFRVALREGHTVVARRAIVPIGSLEALTGGATPMPTDGSSPMPGLFVVDPAADPEPQAVRVSTTASHDLSEEDAQQPAQTSSNEVDWDERYSGDPMWSGNPNGSLVAEVDGMTPGRALDVGAGEGGDAIWLADQGWRVTAADISRRALDRVGKAATGRGLRIERLHVDANQPRAFPAAGFDLVCASYASIPRTPDRRAVDNILRAVAPGGTLLVISHDLAGHDGADAGHGRPVDHQAYVRVQDFAAVLDASPDWTIERHETRPRPAGAASASHHVDDVVPRARRS